MLKKIIKNSVISAALLAGCVSTANAGMYIGPTLFVRDTMATHSSVRELAARMSLGYGDFVAPSFYLAGEIFGMPGSMLLRSNTSSGIGVRNTYSYGISLLPGTAITDSVMGYLRMGLIETRFTSASTTRAGGQIGLGLQTGLTSNWDMRMEYIYSMYGSITNIGSPKGDWIGLGLTYKLDQI